MSIKQSLQDFWKTTQDYGGEISCRKVKEKENCTFYHIETDGNTFEAVVHNDDPNTIFYHAYDSSEWISTDGNDVIELNGIPYILDVGAVPPTSRVSFLAKEAGVSVATIYNRAKELGRLPTVEEAKAKRVGTKTEIPIIFSKLCRPFPNIP